MSEQHIEKHKLVQFTYTITDDASNLLEQIDIPLGYVHGTDSGMFHKIEQALEGHSCGDRVEVTMTPEEGFGPHLPELTYTDDVENVPEQFRQVGAEVQMQNDRGEIKTFWVSRIENGKLTVDGNHPLAGKNLTFAVNVLDIRDATEDEIRQAGLPGQPLVH